MPLYNNNSYSLNETSAHISRFAAPSWVEDNGRANYYPSNERHWGQVVVFPPGTLQVHHKEMDGVPAMNPPRTLQIHFEFPTQFTSDDPSWEMRSTLAVFQVM